MQEILLERPDLPVLCTCDAVICDGSLAGVSAALALAHTGHRVVLVEPRTFLGREITATLCLWVQLALENDLADLPEALAACIHASQSPPTDQEYPLHPDAVKRTLEDLILAAGIRIIYASQPVGLIADDAGLQGIIIGNRSGRQVVCCSLAVDASPTAILSRLSGDAFEPPGSRATPLTRVLEFVNVTAPYPEHIPVPAAFGIHENRANTHRGYRDPGHVLIECPFTHGIQIANPLALSEHEIDLTLRTLELAAHLRTAVPALTSAQLVGSSQESRGSMATCLTGPRPPWAQHVDGTTLTLGIPGNTSQSVTQVPLSRLAGPIRGLWSLNPCARLRPAMRIQLFDPVVASAAGHLFGELLHALWSAVTSHARPSPPLSTELAETRSDPGQLHVMEQALPQRGRHLEHRAVPRQSLPVLYDSDILVAGGGTSGAIAAVAAAERGARTLLVDMNPGPGGTGTYGGVHSHWFGRRVGFAARSLNWVNKVHAQVGLLPAEGEIPHWNAEAKTWALLEQHTRTGVVSLYRTLAIGAIVKDGTVHGLIAATPLGPVALLARVVIDATGDGDIAALAGAQWIYGAARDHVTMWYSLAQVAAPGHTRNNFTSTVDVSNVEDYTRAILSGRRRGRIGPDHDHGVYLAPRESRHIYGDATLTLNDQLLRRSWPDVINIAFSNNDIKGQTTSDWMRSGLIPPNLEIEIPYRALLPQGLDGILVVGKAISATHDALPSVRMQPDLENLGGVAGLAAVISVQRDVPPRDIDVAELQSALVREQVLPAHIPGRQLHHFEPTGPEIHHLLDRLDAKRPLRAYSDMELNEAYKGRIPFVDLCCAGPQVVPLLEQAMLAAQGQHRVLLAQALSLVGSCAGVPTLIAQVENEIRRGNLPERNDEIRHANRYVPDQGAMPDAAYLLYSIGLAGDPRALPLWQHIVDLMADARPEDICNKEKALFHYVDALCAGAERLGDPAAWPILAQLHGYAPFHGHQLITGFQIDPLQERSAYLELVIGRAMARCGDVHGYLILINYLRDVRGLLAEHAHDELSAMAGIDLGKNPSRWGQWLEGAAEHLRPVPWKALPAPTQTWDQAILTAVD